MGKDHSYYMMLANQAAKRGSCYRRQIGCVLVDSYGNVINEGYNGAPLQLGDCLADENLCPGRNIKAGSGGGNLCYSIHAEIRALKDCQRVSEIYALYSTKAPCTQCVLTLLTTACIYIYFETSSNETLNKELWERAGCVWTKLGEC